MILFVRYEAAPSALCYRMKYPWAVCLLLCGETQQTVKVLLLLLTSDECHQFDIFVSQDFILVTDQKIVLEIKYIFSLVYLMEMKACIINPTYLVLVMMFTLISQQTLGESLDHISS